MSHFVSASCEGERCFCGNAATHKLGEEIPHDEPCPMCGSCWRYWEDRDESGRRVLGLPKSDCRGSFHLFGAHNRHNLTAYVCCEHFTQVLGAATGCEL